MAVKKTEERSYDGIAPRYEKEVEELSCKLTDAEWKERATSLAEAHNRTESVKARKKSVMAEINADLKSVEGRETKLSNVVSSGYEQRDVTVQKMYDYEKGMVIKTRTDTNEEISRREMSTHERQGGLFDELDGEGEPGVTDANDFIHSVHEDNKKVNTKISTKNISQ